MWLIGHFKRPLITRDGRVHLPPHCIWIRGATSGSQACILAQTWREVSCMRAARPGAADTRTGDRIISGAPDLRAYNLDSHASNDSRFFVRTPLTPIGGPAGRLREYWTDSLATGPQDDAGSCGAGNPSPGIVTDQEPPRERNIPRPRPAVWWFIKLIEDSVH